MVFLHFVALSRRELSLKVLANPAKA